MKQRALAPTSGAVADYTMRAGLVPSANMGFGQRLAAVLAGGRQ